MAEVDISAEDFHAIVGIAEDLDIIYFRGFPHPGEGQAVDFVAVADVGSSMPDGDIAEDARVAFGVAASKIGPGFRRGNSFDIAFVSGRAYRSISQEDKASP